VLVITGRSDAETRERVKAMGVAPILAKPVQTEAAAGRHRHSAGAQGG